jgi:hypothetical protein
MRCEREGEMAEGELEQKWRRGRDSNLRCFDGVSVASAASEREPAAEIPSAAKTSTTKISTAKMAEREGFEPPIPFRVYRFSRPTVSTAHTPLRGGSG